MFPVILVLSHTLTNTRKKTQICMTDFWNRQNNLFEFCGHLTAGVQEESVESKNLYLFTGVFIAFFSQNGIPIIFCKKYIIKWTVHRPHQILKVSMFTFCYPACKPDREKRGRLLHFSENLTHSAKGSARGHLLQNIPPSCNSHIHMCKKSLAEPALPCCNTSQGKRSLGQNSLKFKQKNLKNIKYSN